MNKLEELASQWGYDNSEGMLEDSIMESVVPGICMNPGCDYTTDVEPDQRGAFCECCHTKTVKSCLEIALF